MITPKEIKQMLEDFENDSGAYFEWYLTESCYASQYGAELSFCEYLAGRINAVKESHEQTKQ